ncbi:unnamed protein product [Candidula unifasciata]|uniref:Peptidase S1 domain-containing protein n=1 Tax=Candidula unifasciata TaxID=100452 RepID=A0A8S3YTT0_9EUPU|nr:unnamed protein product [Candidula unifasciata]
MQIFVFLSIVAVALAAPGPEKRIVNGYPAALFAHPHQASLQVRSGTSWYHSCGGSIIARNKILTAAHCLQGQSAANLRVEVGLLNLYDANNGYKQTVSVASFVIHASYNGNGAGIPNDIGIITLSTSLTLNSNVQIATLAPRGASFAGVRCYITGWGRTVGGGATSAQLLEARITKITTADCAARWPGQNINIRHICVYEASAASGSRPSACNGDSGGPLVCNGYLAGITSWGVSNCSGNYPSVYVRVSEYLDWIAARV